MGDELADRRLAVGAGNGDQRQASARLAANQMRQRAGQCPQAIDPQVGCGPRRIPGKIAPRLPEDGARPARDAEPSREIEAVEPEDGGDAEEAALLGERGEDEVGVAERLLPSFFARSSWLSPNSSFNVCMPWASSIGLRSSRCRFSIRAAARVS